MAFRKTLTFSFNLFVHEKVKKAGVSDMVLQSFGFCSRVDQFLDYPLGSSGLYLRAPLSSHLYLQREITSKFRVKRMGDRASTMALLARFSSNSSLQSRLTTSI